MWILTWKTYKKAGFATFISIVGALLRYASVMCLFSALIPGFLVCLPLGIGAHFLAEGMAFGNWKKRVRAQGFDVAVKNGDANVAYQLYNANPCAKTVKYITELNPELGNKISEALNKK